MTLLGTYGPRTKVHPDRYGAYKNKPQLWIVLHTSEGTEGLNSAEALCSYMERPGDRPNGSGGVYGSSYHVVFDTDRILPCVEEAITSYSAGGGNAQGLHGCFPGKANQTREQWLDPISRAMIKQAAYWIVDMSAKYNIPVGNIAAGTLPLSQFRISQYEKGVTDHYGITKAFRKSTHTDVGPGFPWDVLMWDIISIVFPPQPPQPPTPPPTIEIGDDMIKQTPPVRILDTRTGNQQPGLVFSAPVIPGAKAALVTVTVVPRGIGGFFSEGNNTSFLNWGNNYDAIANTTVLDVKNGVLSFTASTPVHAVVDLVGYYT